MRLVSFFGFLWNAWKWITASSSVCSFFFLCLWISCSSWFVLTLELSARLHVAEYAAVHLQRSDWKRWKTSRQICKRILALKDFLSKRCFLSRKRLSSSNCSFVVHRKRSFWHVTAPNRHAHRIGPIVKRVRNPPIRNAHIYPFDSAGKSRICAIIRRRSMNGLDNESAGLNAG